MTLNQDVVAIANRVVADEIAGIKQVAANIDGQ